MLSHDDGDADDDDDRIHFSVDGLLIFRGVRQIEIFKKGFKNMIESDATHKMVAINKCRLRWQLNIVHMHKHIR